MERIVRYFFFTNIFYGVCAVSLSIETALQMSIPLGRVSFYVVVFSIPPLFYGLSSPPFKKSLQLRDKSVWFENNVRVVKYQYLVLLAALIISLFDLFREVWHCATLPRPIDFFILASIPVIAFLYYKPPNPFSRRRGIRETLFLKPFVICLVWSGLCTLLPIEHYCFISGVHWKPNLWSVLFFTNNVLFIGLLSILFDIKDINLDRQKGLKTFAILLWPQKLILTIVYPITAINISISLYWAIVKPFGALSMVLMIVPYIATALLSTTLLKGRPILYYLIVIDGLMFLKALFGSLAILLFNNNFQL